MIRTVLTDAQWAVIAPHCLGRECDPGRTGPDPRRFVEAVLWISRTGCPWRDLPEEFGRWNSVFKRFPKVGEGRRFLSYVQGISRRCRLRIHDDRR